MSGMIAPAFLILLGIYLACGLIFALPFVLVGVDRMDPHAVRGTWGFRVLIVPGTVFLWPLLAWRWMASRVPPPAETNSSRRTMDEREAA